MHWEKMYSMFLKYVDIEDRAQYGSLYRPIFNFSLFDAIREKYY